MIIFIERFASIYGWKVPVYIYLAKSIRSSLESNRQQDHWGRAMRLYIPILFILLALTDDVVAGDSASVEFPPTKLGVEEYLRSVSSERSGIFIGACRETATNIGITSIYLIVPRTLKENFIVEFNESAPKRQWVNMASVNIDNGEIKIINMTSGGEVTGRIITTSGQLILKNPMYFETSYDKAFAIVPTILCPKIE